MAASGAGAEQSQALRELSAAVQRQLANFGSHHSSAQALESALRGQRQQLERCAELVRALQLGPEFAAVGVSEELCVGGATAAQLSEMQELALRRQRIAELERELGPERERVEQLEKQLAEQGGALRELERTVRAELGAARAQQSVLAARQARLRRLREQLAGQPQQSSGSDVGAALQELDCKLAEMERAVAARLGERERQLHTLAEGSEHAETFPLHAAAAAGAEAEVQRLLAAGANPQGRDGAGWTALHRAAREGRGGAVRQLLAAGADTEAATDGQQQTPLHLAAAAGHEHVVRSLLKAGADRRAADQGGWTALHLAAAEGNCRPLKALLELGADESALAEALYLASRGGICKDRARPGDGHAACARLLLQAGANPAADTRFGWPALWPALDTEFVWRLLEAHPQFVEHGRGQEALLDAVRWGRAAAVEALLLQTGVGVDGDGWNYSPLSAAAERGHADVVRALLARGADVHKERALEGAARSGSVEVVQLLLNAGADVSKENPLFVAAAGGHVGVARLLLKSGAAVNKSNCWKHTPLHEAACNGHVDMARLLLGAGADRAARDGEGKTPLDLARCPKMRKALS